MDVQCLVADHYATEGDALQAKGQVAAITEDRHGEKVIAVDVRDRILPTGQAADVPKFPEEPADQRSQACGDDRAPIDMGQGCKDGFSPGEGLQASNDENRRDP